MFSKISESQEMLNFRQSAETFTDDRHEPTLNFWITMNAFFYRSPFNVTVGSQQPRLNEKIEVIS